MAKLSSDLLNRFNVTSTSDPKDALKYNTWDGIKEIVTDASAGTKVKDAFLNGLAEMVILPAGTVLYKFNQYNSLQSQADAEAGKPISPWWSPYYPFRHDPGWIAKKGIAQRLGVSVREWGRVTSAVKENWNSLMWLCVITLKARIPAAFGSFAKMLRIDPGAKSKVDAGLPAGGRSEGRGQTGFLPGGGTQFYIYNLKAFSVDVRFESLANC